MLAVQRGEAGSSAPRQQSPCRHGGPVQSSRVRAVHTTVHTTVHSALHTKAHTTVCSNVHTTLYSDVHTTVHATMPSKVHTRAHHSVLAVRACGCTSGRCSAVHTVRGEATR